mmetsp:Transcript_7410/g.10684  ORF Transcript_7410/g.10684 Transcript_7410/m.10684 type:complete len:104 (-) Transcript_7410:16-327(-)
MRAVQASQLTSRVAPNLFFRRSFSGFAGPCGAACGTPEKCGADIAHKAVGSTGATYGWSKKYADNWERIFAEKAAKKQQQQAQQGEVTPAAGASQQASATPAP